MVMEDSKSNYMKVNIHLFVLLTILDTDTNTGF